MPLTIPTQCNHYEGISYRSSFRKSYIRNINIMKDLYKIVLDELKQKYENTSHFPICRERQNNYYVEIPD